MVDAIQKTFTAFFGTIGIGVFLWLFRWVWHGISDTSSSVKSWFSDSVEEVNRSGWVFEHFKWTFIVAACMFVVLMCYFLFTLLLYVKAKKRYIKECKLLNEHYNKIIANFE